MKRFLDAMWCSTAPSTIALAFGSDDSELQKAVVYDCYGLGRIQPAYLVLLRRVMFGLRPEVLDLAIYVLNECSLNMDLFLDPNWMSMKNRKLVRQHLLWTVDEAIEMLDRTQDSDGFERASFSSCIYWLLVGPEPYSNHFIELAEAAALRAAALGREHAAKWALFLRIYWAGESGWDVLQRLFEVEPILKSYDLAHELEQHLTEYGDIAL